MWNFICPELLRAIETESEPDVLLELMDSMAKCVEFLGSGCLTEEWMTSLLSFINRTMSEHFQNEVDRLEKRKDEDYDEVCVLSHSLPYLSYFMNVCLHKTNFSSLT